MFEFDRYKKELLPFCIPDIADIIIDYVAGPVEFTKDFIQDCITNKEYLFYNKKHKTLLSWITDYKGYATLCKFYNNIPNIRAEHLQNKNSDGFTELHTLCYCKSYNVIIKIRGLKVKHFLNRDKDNRSELYVMCYNRMYKTLKYLYDHGIKFKKEHCYTNREMYYLKAHGLSKIKLI